MFRDLLSSSAKLTDEASAYSQSACNSINSAVLAGADKLTLHFNKTLDCSKSHVDSLNAQNLENLNINSSSISQIEVNNASTYSALSNISNTVSEKREMLIETVDTITQHVQVAIVQACTVVDATSEQATSILNDVKHATTKMNGTASQSMSQFVDFMDKEGQHISSELSNHFRSVDMNLDNQRAGLVDIRSVASDHNVAQQNDVVLASGLTPRKLVSKKLPPLVSTRDHADIKDESKGLKIKTTEPISVVSTSLPVCVVEPIAAILKTDNASTAIAVSKPEHPVSVIAPVKIALEKQLSVEIASEIPKKRGVSTRSRNQNSENKNPNLTAEA
jgi:hypothetical protein